MSPRRTRRSKAVSRVTLVVQARRAQQAVAEAVHHADDPLPAADTIRQAGPADAVQLVRCVDTANPAGSGSV